MARLVAQGLTESLGQSVVIDNKPGASGNIAASEVARATPDGYTLFISPTSVETVNPHLIKSNLLPSRDLTPVQWHWQVTNVFGDQATKQCQRCA
jgi:tripartite-type tricarboxylate transporter receptor subunit TctC